MINQHHKILHDYLPNLSLYSSQTERLTGIMINPAGYSKIKNMHFFGDFMENVVTKKCLVHFNREYFIQ